MGNSAPSISTVVFDTSTGFFGIDSESSVGLSILKEELELEGFYVTDNVLMNIEADEVTKRLLQRADVLVLVNPNRDFSSGEMDLVKNFVNGGGKLLLICDTPESAENMNELSRTFSVEFMGNYFLGDDLVISSQNISPVHLTSAIPLDLKVETEVSLQSGEIDAKKWFSVWERPEEIIKRDNFTVFARVRYGKGSVAFLGDKDVLLNENIVKGDNLQFVQSIFDRLTYEMPEKTDNRIVYYPNQLSFVVEKGKISVASLRIENKGDVNQTLRFKVPSYLTETMNIDREVLDISPDETMMIRIEITGMGGNYSHVSDFIIVEREYDYYTREDYISVEILSKT